MEYHFLWYVLFKKGIHMGGKGERGKFLLYKNKPESREQVSRHVSNLSSQVGQKLLFEE